MQPSPYLHAPTVPGMNVAWGSTLCDQLAVAAVFHRTGVVNLAHGYVGQAPALTAAAVDQRGAVLTAATSRIQYAPDSWALTFAETGFSLFTIVDLQGSGSHVAYKSDNNGAQGFWLEVVSTVGVAGGSEMELAIVASSNNRYRAILPEKNRPFQGRVVYGCSYLPTRGPATVAPTSAFHAFYDGFECTSYTTMPDAGSAGRASDVAQPLMLGLGLSGPVTSTPNIIMQRFYLWRRALSPQEHLQLGLDPEAIFRVQARTPLPHVQAAAGGWRP